jgi:hypothetical protein
MSRSNALLTIATGILAVITALQAFLFYRIVNLDTAGDYGDIPTLLGFNILLYAAVMLIYLRIFIGVNAYKKVSDVHPR